VLSPDAADARFRVMTWNVESLFDVGDGGRGSTSETWQPGTHARTDRVPHPSHDLIEWT